MVKFKAAVVEDEYLSGKALTAMLLKHDLFVEVCNYFDPKKFLMDYESKQFDVVFMDINLGKHSGLDLAEAYLKSSNNNGKLIFVTAFDEFAIPAIKMGATDYLLKPYNHQDIENIVKKLKGLTLDSKTSSEAPTYSESVQKPLYRITGARNTYLVEKRDIVCVNGAGNYLELHTLNKSYLQRANFIDFIAATCHFGMTRVHRSAAVNINHIKQLNTDGSGCITIITQMDHKLKLSDSYKQAFLQKLDEIC